ncbi:hypothetical protein ACSBR2_038376 [Camellia fascicularis]
MSFSYYEKAIDLNPSAVDAVYRMHASRLKLLCTRGKQNKEVLKVVAEYSFSESTKENVMKILSRMGTEIPDLLMDVEDKSIQTNPEDTKLVDSHQLEEAWHMLYRDCLSALEICCKTPGLSGNRKVLEVHLPESSRKFVTCIRKYILFYWKLLEEAGDICTLDRAYISIRADKSKTYYQYQIQFPLCLEDLVLVALGRYVTSLISSTHQTENVGSGAASRSEHLLEKIFSLFIEQMNLWSDLCYLPQIIRPELTESSLYGYLYQYIQLLERNNPKLSNSNCAKVYKHVSVAWYRSLVISLALITPLHSGLSSEIQVRNPSDLGSESSQQLCVDLQTNELWNSSFEDPNHLKNLETKWNPLLSKIKNVIIKKASEQDLETAATPLRCSYNLSRDTSCAVLPSSVNLYVVPFQLATAGHFYPGLDGVNALDLNIPRKLL